LILRLPLAAVANTGDRPFVFVASPGGGDGEAVVGKKPVEIGELTENGVEILAGLEHGVRVITAGVSVIREGQRVLVD